MLIVKSMQTSV